MRFPAYCNNLLCSHFSLSLSTLSMSSGSSLGSLGSLSASSRGSLNSLSTLDVYGQATGVTGSSLGVMGSEVNLQELHQRVEKLLQGHSMSPISEAASPTTTPVPHADVTAAATNSYLQSVMGGGAAAAAPTGSSSSEGATAKSSPYSSTVSSPPVSPYGLGAPPSYEQHMSCMQRLSGLLPGSTGSKWGRSPNTDLTPQTILEAEESGLSSSSHVNHPAALPPDSEAGSNPALPLLPAVPPSSLTPVLPPYPHQPPPTSTSSSLPHTEPCQGAMALSLSSSTTGGVVESVTGSNQTCVRTDRDMVMGVLGASGGQRRPMMGMFDNVEVLSNPPLSPISESSSGVGNNLSGGNTRSVSAAVSDESVAGDSGVFEASIKR